jgi:hypothetical protein
MQACTRHIPHAPSSTSILKGILPRAGRGGGADGRTEGAAEEHETFERGACQPEKLSFPKSPTD